MTYDIVKEKREAIEAGERALRSLRQAKSDLNSARGWGIYDLLGGGMISTLIKHSRMNNAEKNISDAKWELQRFARELDDVEDVTGVDFGIGDLATFADFFFDGMLADFYVQTKINNARAQVDEAIRRVEYVILKLRQ